MIVGEIWWEWIIVPFSNVRDSWNYHQLSWPFDPGLKLQISAKLLTYTLDFIVMQMSRVDREKGN